jgi:hypothetical protein
MAVERSASRQRHLVASFKSACIVGTTDFDKISQFPKFYANLLGVKITGPFCIDGTPPPPGKVGLVWLPEG